MFYLKILFSIVDKSEKEDEGNKRKFDRWGKIILWL